MPTSQVPTPAVQPDFSSRKYSKYQAVICDRHINLGDLYRQLNDQQLAPTHITLYADTVTVPAHLHVLLTRNSLTIVSRKLVVEEEAQITLDFTTSVNNLLVLFAQEIVGPLRIHAVTGNADTSAVYEVQELQQLGEKFYYTEGAPARLPLGVMEAPMTDEGSVLHLSLMSSYLYASVLVDSDPATAYEVLRWIRRCTEPVPQFQEMFVQSSSLLILLQSNRSKSVFVPQLSSNVYSDSASAYVQVAKEYERLYERFSDQQAEWKYRKEAAEQMLAASQDKNQFTDQLIDQCQHNLDVANKTLEESVARFQKQMTAVDNAKQAFSTSLVKWEDDQKWKVRIQILTAVFEFGTAVGSMVVSGGAAAPVAAQKGAEAVAAVGKASETASKLDAILKKFGELEKVKAKLDELGKLMKKIAQVAKLLGAVHKFTKSLGQATSAVEHAGSFVKDMEEIGWDKEEGKDQPDTTYWKQFVMELDGQIQPAIDEGISEAQDYKLQLDILALYGDDIIAKQVSLMQISQELVRLQLQKELGQKNTARLTQYVHQMQEGQTIPTEMMQLFYRHYLDQKVALFTALMHYRRAYFYWALREAGGRPSLTDRVEVLDTKLSQIHADYQKALESFDPHPQKFDNLTYTINRPDLLEAFREHHALEFTLDTSEGIFAGFNRIRLSCIRVELTGLGNTPTEVYLRIESSGTYQDRWKQQQFQFLTDSLLLGFVYNPKTSKVIVDGQLTEEVRYSYFEPTPFTTWRISLPEHVQYNKGLDLSQITAIEMKFSGHLLVDANK